MMNRPSIDEILASRPEARPRIYAYSIADKAHAGLLKVGQTTRVVKKRVAEQLKTANIKNYKIELDESAERDDGTIFTDRDVRATLCRKGFENTALEWMRCTVADIKTVLTELRTGLRFIGTHKVAKFRHKFDVQKWLDIIRGSYSAKTTEFLKTGTRPPFPYSDVRLLPYLQHSFWFLPNVAA